MSILYIGPTYNIFIRFPKVVSESFPALAGCCGLQARILEVARSAIGRRRHEAIVAIARTIRSR